MQHPRDPFSDDSADDAEAFSRPRSSPRRPGGPEDAVGPLPAPTAPPETHHAEAIPFADDGAYGDGARPESANPGRPYADTAGGPELPPPPEDLPFDSQVLFEPWEPPMADPRWDVPELARVGGPARGGPPADRPPRRVAPPPEYWSGPRHARFPGRRRGHWGGALLALTGALALAGAVPIGILGVRTLTQHPVAVVTTAPMANGSAISAPPSVAAAAPSQLAQGQTAAGPASSGASSHAAQPGPAKASTGKSSAGAAGAAGAGGETTAKAATFAVTAGPGCRSLSGVVTWPFRAPTGDGWHPATATRSGPCGTSFSYSLLANVKDDSGNWHDHYAWIFHTGKKVASCTLSVYVPQSQHASGAAFYWFSAGSASPQNRMADFTLDQRASQGQWVTKGPFTFPGGTVLAEVTDRGIGPAADSVEASALQLRCV
jgi:hypothetical protein